MKKFTESSSLKSQNMELINNNLSQLEKNQQKKKIKEEKRRRNQAYLILDYYLFILHFFDFFSYDAFRIAKKSKQIAKLCNKNLVTTEFLLIPFFDSLLPYSSLLSRFGLNEKKIGEEITTLNKLNSIGFFKSLKNKMTFSLKLIINKINSESFSEINKINFDTEYSKEVYFLFEKASENAVTRFKTPVISSEILLITMIEEKNTRVGKLIQQAIPNEADWYYLRFFLLKKLHSKELIIRNCIKKNLRYFAYLFIKEISDSEFEKYQKNNTLQEAIYSFRDELIQRLLEKNLFSDIVEETYCSIHSTSNRTYSF